MMAFRPSQIIWAANPQVHFDRSRRHYFGDFAVTLRRPGYTQLVKRGKEGGLMWAAIDLRGLLRIYGVRHSDDALHNLLLLRIEDFDEILVQLMLFLL